MNPAWLVGYFIGSLLAVYLLGCLVGFAWEKFDPAWDPQKRDVASCLIGAGIAIPAAGLGGGFSWVDAGLTAGAGLVLACIVAAAALIRPHSPPKR